MFFCEGKAEKTKRDCVVYYGVLSYNLVKSFVFKALYSFLLFKKDFHAQFSSFLSCWFPCFCFSWRLRAET